MNTSKQSTGKHAEPTADTRGAEDESPEEANKSQGKATAHQPAKRHAATGHKASTGHKSSTAKHHK